MTKPLAFTDDEIKTHLACAIKKLRMDDAHLLMNNAGERCIVHRLAVYIEQLFAPYGYNVDCEYNLDSQGDTVTSKRAESYTRKEGRKPEGVRRTSDVCVTPDIVIHIRGSKEHNLLAVEIKVTDYRAVRESQAHEYVVDCKKLMEYTLKSGHFAYQIGARIRLYTRGFWEDPESIEWFSNGIGTSQECLRE